MQSLFITSDGGETVPAVLALPKGLGRAPAVLLLHGFSSRKERMADSIGRALVKQGVASLAIDLPLHGEREGDVDRMTTRNPMALIAKWHLALRETIDALDFLSEHPAIDATRLGVAGYSLGAFIAITAAATDIRVRAVALAAGGDLPARTPFASLVRAVADPIRSVRALAGRPLLMVNGRSDRTVRPEQATALYTAAGKPKEIRWYDGGHWPPSPVIDDTARWLAAELGAARPQIRLA